MNNSYVNYLKSEKKSSGTIKTYVNNIEECLSHIGKADCEIKYIDLINYMATVQNLSSATIATKISAIKSYFEFLASIDLIAENPAAKMKRPSVHSKEKSALSAEQISAMINAAPTYRIKALISLLASTGLRISEALNITIEEYNNRINDTITVLGKGAKWRNITLSEQTISYLDKYIEKERHNGCEYLFVSNYGGKMASGHTTEALRTAAKKANLENWKELCITNHTMRHSCATIMVDRGVDVSVVSKALGHSSIAITSRYLHPSSDKVANAMAAMSF